jgi:allophanate hydrolase subunit 1
MRELSINYPKTKVDDEKLEKYLRKYKLEHEHKVRIEMERIRFNPLDVSNAD